MRTKVVVGLAVPALAAFLVAVFALFRVDSVAPIETRRDALDAASADDGVVPTAGLDAIEGPSELAVEPRSARVDAKSAPPVLPLLVEVRDPSGAPVPAYVWIDVKAKRSWKRVLEERATDESGRVTLDLAALPAGTLERPCRIGASAKGDHFLSQQRWSVEHVPIPEGATEVTVTLVPASLIKGTIRWSDGFAPSDGSTVLLGNGGAPVASGSTEAGAFEILGFEGTASELRLAEKGTGAIGRLAIDLAIARGEMVERAFVVDRPATLRAIVTDRASGEPVAGARASGFDPAAATRAQAAVSDRGGILVVPYSLSRGEEPALTFAHDAYLPRVVRVPRVATDTVVLDVELERAPTISGLVVDGRGRALAGVAIRAVGVEDPGGPDSLRIGSSELARATSDEDGRFRLPVPARDGFELTYRLPGTSTVPTLASERVTVAEAIERGRWVVPDVVMVRGLVVEADGTPAAIVRVGARRAGSVAASGTATDREGEFELRATPGRWHVYVEHGSAPFDGGTLWRKTAIEVDVGRGGLGGVLLRLRPSAGEFTPVRVAVRAIDRASGASLAPVSMRWTGVDSGFSGDRPTSGAEGSLEILAPAGRHLLWLAAEGRAPVTLPVELGSHETVRVLDVVVD